MARLWDKGYEVNRELHRFTVGDDYLLDLALIEPDCIASAAHARMLAKIGILKPEQADKLVANASTPPAPGTTRSSPLCGFTARFACLR